MYCDRLTLNSSSIMNEGLIFLRLRGTCFINQKKHLVFNKVLKSTVYKLTRRSLDVCILYSRGGGGVAW